MSATTYPDDLTPVGDQRCQVYVHDFGLLTLPCLHDMDKDAEERLLDGDVHPFLNAIEDKDGLIGRLLISESFDIARFFTAWIHAGYDYELAAWSAWLKMVEGAPALARTDDNGNQVDEQSRDSLAYASLLAESAGDIAYAIVERMS